MQITPVSFVKHNGMIWLFKEAELLWVCKTKLWNLLPCSIHFLKYNISVGIVSKTSKHVSKRLTVYLPWSQLRSIMFYFSSESPPAWMDLESCSVTPSLPLHLYLYSADSKYLRKNTDNPFVLNMIKVGFDACKYLNINSSWSRFSPIWGKVNFQPGKCDSAFWIWAEKGFRKVQDMYSEDKVLMSFAEISPKWHSK